MEKKKLNISESPALLLVEQEFKWYSEIGKRDCECRLRIYKITFDKAVVIASELKDNSGCSITDEAITLINLVCYKFGLSPSKTMWVEHKSEGYLKSEDSYDEIWLSMFHVQSRRIKKQNLETLLGTKL